MTVEKALPLKALLMLDRPDQLLMSLSLEEIRAIEPSLADLKMPIPKGFHHKDNLEHSIRVLGSAIDQEDKGPDLILRTAALFHDIGKPATRDFSEGKPTFWSHEIVGAKMLAGILKKHSYSKDEIKQVRLLVSLHMRAYGFTEVKWTDSAVRRLVKDAGGMDNFKKLLILFRSDLTTTNKERKRKVLEGIKRLEDFSEQVHEKDLKASRRPALDGHEVMAKFDLEPGKELGKLMRFLYTEEGLVLTREEALERLKKMLETS